METANHLILLLLLLCIFPPKSSSLTVEKTALLEFKSQLKDPTNLLRSWVDFNSPCEFSGVSCDPKTGMVTGIVLDNMSLGGELSPCLCKIQGLTSLVLTSNSIYGVIPPEMRQCSMLRVLNLTQNNMVGRLPDLSGLRNLEVLGLSSNSFTGEFPTWVAKLSGLKYLGLGNNSFDEGRIPESLGNLKNLTYLFLYNCKRVGEIPESIYGLKELSTLDLSKNSISGTLSKSIGNLTKITQIELFRNNLSGEIPTEIAKLSLLQELDISNNHLYGKLPPELGNLKNLTVFEVHGNDLSGEVPLGFADLQHLYSFSIYMNRFSGEFPANFGRYSPLTTIDISENNFTGAFPSFLCKNQSLKFLLAVANAFSGAFPVSYAQCKSLERFRVNRNSLSGKLPDGIWAMPNIGIMDFGDNDFVGHICSGIGNSISMSELILENNRFSGVLPPELGKLARLERLYLSNNSFTGDIPPQIGDLKKLSSLQLQANSLSGSIPSELGQCTSLADLNLAHNLLGSNIPDTLMQMTSLNSLNLSSNKLTGPIPNSLGKLKLSLIDLSKNQLSGTIPQDVLQIGGEDAFLGNNFLCTQQTHPKPTSNKFMTASIILSILAVALAALLFLLIINYRHYKVEVSHDTQVEGTSEMPPKWKVQSFHRLGLEFDVDDICNLEERNLIASGATAKVYRLDLQKNGPTTVAVAVKRLCCNKGTDLEFKVMATEMGILGRIKHRNILKLYACILRGSSAFLVLEYMEKGNLFQAIHRLTSDGEPELDWKKRFNIASGVAKALEYLHYDSSPPIIHRDVKSTNILLDGDYEPKLADFGVARAKHYSTTGSDQSDYNSFAGTHGYIAPELAYTWKVSEKSDVYSFGVMLLELLTSRASIEGAYGEGKDIVNWVRNSLNDQKNEMHILDQRLMVSHLIEEQMMKVLNIATICTTQLPSLRPTMRDVTKLLVHANPSTSTSVAHHILSLN